MITDVGRVFRISNLFTCPLDSITNSKQADFRLANKTHKDLKTWIILMLTSVIIIMNCEL